MIGFQELIELTALQELIQICTINLLTLLGPQIACLNPVLMVVVTTILGLVVIIQNQVVITQDQVIIITNRLEAQIILVQVTLDRVLDIAHHQAHHFQEVVEECRQDQVHLEVVNLEDNF